jgi:hypothetical protein
MSLDCTCFNVQTVRGTFLCPACGFGGAFDGSQFETRGGIIGRGICPCCFYEPGFDDDPMASADAQPTVLLSIASYRANWIAAGMPWRATMTPAPVDWRPETQLATLAEVAPFLFA